MVRFTRSSPSVFAYCKRSKTEAREGLGTRLDLGASCLATMEGPIRCSFCMATVMKYFKELVHLIQGCTIQHTAGCGLVFGLCELCSCSSSRPQSEKLHVCGRCVVFDETFNSKGCYMDPVLRESSPQQRLPGSSKSCSQALPERVGCSERQIRFDFQ